jgi:hypothetical protein
MDLVGDRLAPTQQATGNPRNWLTRLIRAYSLLVGLTIAEAWANARADTISSSRDAA